MAVSKKSRCWWFVQLLENLPADWRTQLHELMIPGAYIVHDRDTVTDDEGVEKPKKPHVHCILEFGNAVRADTVLQALPASFGVLFCKPVPNKVGAYRYLVHIGQEDKAQYDLSEVVDMAGFSVNLSNVMNVDFGDVYQLITELEITSFSALLALLVEHKPEYLDYVTAHVNLVKSFVNDYARHTL